MMPTNLEYDAPCIQKKRHIGNDFVNIIFNNSGLPFSFDTFPSDFNYVYIVITPEARATFVETRARARQDGQDQFYKVQ
ncbi:Tuberous sclerosis 2-like protein, partial [Cryomyces antarcticus]